MKQYSDDKKLNVADTKSAIANYSILSFISANSFMALQKFYINVQLLDRNRIISESFKKSCNGQDVLDYVCKSLNIVEKEYFGLQYENNKYRFWIDLSKPLSKQFYNKSLTFRFRFRFYPSDPIQLKESITRYQLFAQLRRDLLHGRLTCPKNEAALLAGLLLQANLGDYNEATMSADSDYVSEYYLLAKQSPLIEEKIAAAHRCNNGLSPEEAEAEFLNIACKLETYGFDPYVVKDFTQTNEITIGANHVGILIFFKNQIINSFKWSDIEKIDYIAKQLVIFPSKKYFTNYNQKTGDRDVSLCKISLFNMSLDEIAEDKNKSKQKKACIKLFCSSTSFAKHLWKHLLAQQVFFTEDKANLVKPKFSKPRIPLFSRGSTFRCPTLRVLHEIQSDHSPPRESLVFERYPLAKHQPRSINEPWINAKSLTNQINNETINNNNIKTLDENTENSNIENNNSTNQIDNNLLLTTDSLEQDNNQSSASSNEKAFAKNDSAVIDKLSSSYTHQNGFSNINKLETKNLYSSSSNTGISFFFAILVFVVTAAILIAFFFPGAIKLTSEIKISDKITWPSWLPYFSLSV